jgi:hypothetical protein
MMQRVLFSSSPGISVLSLERDPTLWLLLMASLVQHEILPRGEIRSRVDLSPAFHTEVQPALSMTDGRRHYYFSFVLAVPLFVTYIILGKTSCKKVRTGSNS